MLRRTPLKRSTKPLVRIRPERRKERQSYNRDRLEYLAAHPFCQISIFAAGLKEQRVIDAGGRYSSTGGQMKQIPRSTQIHHRNKARGKRLNDQRFWMSASAAGHDMVEQNKEFARRTGLLLPFEANADGLCPNGEQWPTTPEMML